MNIAFVIPVPSVIPAPVVIPAEAGILFVLGVKPGIGVHVMPTGHPGTVEVVVANELRYTVVEALGASRVVRIEGETEPPPLEYEMVGVAGITGQALVVKVVSAGYVDVPAEFTAYGA